MARNAALELARAEDVCLVAPAGFGKTDVIARAVAHHSTGPQLILTHTHAGVRALRRRLARYGATARAFHLDTIAGFALRYAASRPRTAQLSTAQPVGNQWQEVYGAAEKVLHTPLIGTVLKNSFTGVFVDEYQDCAQAQHSLILRLKELLPTRIVGDPLQGIFDFEGGVVDWDADVFPVFARLDDLDIAWRWRTTNPALGEWLLELRNNLINGTKTNLDGAPLDWIASTHPAQQLAACRSSPRGLGQSL
jgi:superfamily I DNA/RNA helicase